MNNSRTEKAMRKSSFNNLMFIRKEKMHLITSIHLTIFLFICLLLAQVSNYVNFREHNYYSFTLIPMRIILQCYFISFARNMYHISYMKRM